MNRNNLLFIISLIIMKKIIGLLLILFVSLKLYNIKLKQQLPDQSITIITPWHILNYNDNNGMKIKIYLNNNFLIQNCINKIHQNQWENKFFKIIKNNYIIENIRVNKSIKIFLKNISSNEYHRFNNIPWPPEKNSLFIKKKSSVIFH